jgi:hypothetical protein
MLHTALQSLDARQSRHPRLATQVRSPSLLTMNVFDSLPAQDGHVVWIRTRIELARIQGMATQGARFKARPLFLDASSSSFVPRCPCRDLFPVIGRVGSSSCTPRAASMLRSRRKRQVRVYVHIIIHQISEIGKLGYPITLRCSPTRLAR